MSKATRPTTLASALAILLYSLVSVAQAGDAVALAYNKEGVWTMVTYYSSSTPKGGADYRDEAGARDAAVADLKKRVTEGLTKTSVLASSDRTGHFAYARGKTAAGKDVHAVGFGKSKEQADKAALEQLKREGVTTEPKVIYDYFSHGTEAESAALPARK